MTDGELFDRWIGILRHKAAEYEHAARKRGERITAPDLDNVCNEMEAFMTGRGTDRPIPMIQLAGERGKA